MECLRKSAAAVSCLCNLSPYLLAIGAFRWVSRGRDKLPPHYVRQVIIQQEHWEPPQSQDLILQLGQTALYHSLLWNAIEGHKFFWRASEEMESWTSHSHCLHFPAGEWDMETEPCPGSCRKCFGNDSILLHILAVQLPAPMYLLHRAITQNMSATGDSNPKYSLPAYTKCKLAQTNLFILTRTN